MANRALVIGSQTGGLTGVENDARNVAALLRKRAFEVELRTRDDATRTGILEGYDTLIAGVGDKDAAVVYYSGHGNFILSSDDASRDRLQDIVPFDYDKGTKDDYRGISSKELSIKLRQLVAKTKNATVILDCCHSAQMTRDGAARDAVARALPHPLHVDLRRYHSKLEELYPGELAALGTEGNVDAVRIVACAQSELAMEYTNSNGQRTGAFTEAFLELFGEIGDTKVSWAELGQAIRQRVLKRFPGQRPDVEGPVDRQIFSLVALPQRNAVAITRRGQIYEINAGYVHTVHKGDRYDVVPFSAQSRRVAQAIVASTTATTARVDLTWLGGETTLPDDPLAIAVARAAVTYPVTVIAPDDERTRISAAIATARTLHVAADSEKDKSVATLRVVENRLTIEDAYGPLFPEAEYPWSLADAVSNLKNLGVAQALRELEGRTQGVYPRELAIEWGVVEDGETRKLADHGSPLGLGDRVYCKVKSTAKRKLHIHIFNIGLRGKVTLLTRWAPSGIGLSPGEETFLGEAFDGTRTGLALGWPEGLPKTTFPRVDTLLVIATVNPANLGVLETEEVVMRGPVVARSSLEQLLGQLQTGVTREISAAPQIDGHLAKQLTYLLHPRDGKVSSPDFLVDDAPGAKGSARSAAAWRAPKATEPRNIAIRLGELHIADNHAWFATDIRVDALICTRPVEGAAGYRPETLRFMRIRDGERAPLDNARLYDGPVRDFVDICLWVSRDTSNSDPLTKLLAARATEPEVKDALATLLAAAGVSAAPWVAAVGAGAVLARVAYDVILAAAGATIGLYRTSFLAEENYGVGRYPKQGLYRAQDFSFSLVIDAHAT